MGKVSVTVFTPTVALEIHSDEGATVDAVAEGLNDLVKETANGAVTLSLVTGGTAVLSMDVVRRSVFIVEDYEDSE